MKRINNKWVEEATVLGLKFQIAITAEDGMLRVGVSDGLGGDKLDLNPAERKNARRGATKEERALAVDIARSVHINDGDKAGLGTVRTNQGIVEIQFDLSGRGHAAATQAVGEALKRIEAEAQRGSPPKELLRLREEHERAIKERERDAEAREVAKDIDALQSIRGGAPATTDTLTERDYGILEAIAQLREIGIGPMARSPSIVNNYLERRGQVYDAGYSAGEAAGRQSQAEETAKTKPREQGKGGFVEEEMSRRAGGKGSTGTGTPGD